MSNQIPNVVHYIWVGPKPFPAYAQRCLESWKRYLPDYEIKKWDETNSPMDHPYVQMMYAENKWAFVSDYIRFWVLYHEGGLYLDTDTLVLKNMDDMLDENQVVIGKTKDGMVACGVIAAQPGSPFIKSILDHYDSITDSSLEHTSPRITTEVYQVYPNTQDIKVLDYPFFYPCDAQEYCSKSKMELAYTHNLWAESWVSYRYPRKIARWILRRLGILDMIKTGIRKVQ